MRQHAISLGGLVDSHVRKKAWPKLAGVNVFDIPLYLGPPLSSHKDRAQVLLDVNRCGRRIPASELTACSSVKSVSPPVHVPLCLTLYTLGIR